MNVNLQQFCSTSVFSSGRKCEQTFSAPALDFLEGYKIAIYLQNKPNRWKKLWFLSPFFIPVINTSY